jgi:hypothetical protein
MKLTYLSRPVRVELDSNSRDPVDAYVAAGHWRDTGELLTDDELDAIQSAFAGEIQDAWWQDMIEAAADYDHPER